MPGSSAGGPAGRAQLDLAMVPSQEPQVDTGTAAAPPQQGASCFLLCNMPLHRCQYSMHAVVLGCYGMQAHITQCHTVLNIACLLVSRAQGQGQEEEGARATGVGCVHHEPEEHHKGGICQRARTA